MCLCDMFCPSGWLSGARLKEELWFVLFCCMCVEERKEGRKEGKEMGILHTCSIFGAAATPFTACYGPKECEVVAAASQVG